MTARAAILIVDDEPGIRDMLSYELSQEGFDVETAESGMAAMEAIKRRKFDVALTDLKMPGMDGVATVEALRTLDGDIEVIVATGYATVETAVACMKNGAYDYIEKPYDLAQLTLLIERAMQKSELQGMVALYEASRALLTTLKQSDLVGQVVKLAQNVLHAEHAGLVLCGPADGQLTVHRLGPGGGVPDELLLDLARRGIRERRPIRLPSSNTSEPSASSPGVEAYSAALAYPLVARENVVGALVVLREPGARPFSFTELQKATVFANQIALSLDNARLYANLEVKIAELISTRENLVQAEKLALAGRLAGSVAHEVNNPLSFVRNNLDSLRDYSSMVISLWLAAKAAAVHLRSGSDPISADHATRLVSAAGDEEQTERLVLDIVEIVDDTLEGVRRIAELVAGFTHLAGGEEGLPRERVDVVELIRQCVSTIPGATSADQFVIAPEAGAFVTLVAREDLQAAVLNVLVYLTVGREHAGQSPTTIRVANVAGRPCVSIENGALKLSEEERRRLFDPRVEVDTTQGRTMRLNIALTLSWQLLRRNGAEISVHAADDGGTVFRLLLPALGATPRPPSSARMKRLAEAALSG